jgi:hypothetical protein
MVQFKREKAEILPIIYLYAGRELLTKRVSFLQLILGKVPLSREVNNS